MQELIRRGLFSFSALFLGKAIFHPTELPSIAAAFTMAVAAVQWLWTFGAFLAVWPLRPLFPRSYGHGEIAAPTPPWSATFSGLAGGKRTFCGQSGVNRFGQQFLPSRKLRLFWCKK